MIPFAIVQDAVARIVGAACAVEDGDYNYAHAILLGLEVDLKNAIYEEQNRRLGLDDFNDIPDMTVFEETG